MSELNKCGCGGEAKSITHDESFISYVRCTNCGTEGPRLPTKEQAIKLWNTCFPTPVSKEDLIKVIKKNWLRYNLKDYWSNDTIIESEAEAIINKYSVHERNE